MVAGPAAVVQLVNFVKGERGVDHEELSHRADDTD